MTRQQEMSCWFLLLILFFGLNGPALAAKPYVLSVQQLKGWSGERFSSLTKGIYLGRRSNDRGACWWFYSWDRFQYRFS